MDTLKTFYQLDSDCVFIAVLEAYTKPHLAVLEPPPAIPEGMVALFKTVLDPIMSINFGDYGTGDWLIVEDHRKTQLYKKTNGDQFEFDQFYNGLGAIPEHLTTKPRPTSDHVWKDDDWWLDPALAELRHYEAKKSEVDARIVLELAKTTQRISPLQDAVDLEEATEDELALYTALKKYRVLLNRVITQEGYPLNVDWPVEP